MKFHSGNTWFLVVISLLLVCMRSFALTANEADSTSFHEENIEKIRSFESLNQRLKEASLLEEDILTAETYQKQDSSVSPFITRQRARAKAVFDLIKQGNKYVDYLDEQSLLELPVGITRTIGNIAYTIGIDSIIMEADGAYLTAYMELELPSTDKTIAFSASGIRFSKNGGIEPEKGKLELLGDYPIEFNGQTLLVLKGGGATSVRFDCGGFQGLDLSAEVIFSRDFIIPELQDGSQGTGRVKSTFETSLTDWNDFLVELSMPSFQVSGVEGVGFHVSNAVFDFSDLRNATSVTFPEGYTARIGLTDNQETWRGFYLRDISVSLPRHFKRENENGRITFSGKNLIIDGSGFSGLLEAENLIAIDEGNMDGWAYSLSHIALEFESSQLISGGFEGDIVLPISEEKKAFEYSAVISPDNEYLFTVKSMDKLDFPAIGASELSLFPNSSIEVRLVDDEFLPKASLYGRMDIRTAKDKLSLADISFENLQLQTVGPYISADYFSFGSEAAEQAMKGYPVQIKNIAFQTESEEEFAIGFDLSVNVTEVFSGESGARIIGAQIKDQSDLFEWELRRVKIENISMDIRTSAFDISGRLAFYENDEVYGDGFNGQVQARINALNLAVESSAIFGKVDGYRYWYFDAGVTLPVGIPIFAGIEITGFAGGAYQRMRLAKEGGSELGLTNSGLVYEPDPVNGLGLKASVTFAATGGTAYNGDAGFEIAFFKGGGVRYINFKGNAYFMTAPMTSTLGALKEKAQQLGEAVAKLEEAAGDIPGAGLIAKNNMKDQTLSKIYGEIGKGAEARGAISAHCFIELDFENKSLYGLFEAYVNVGGGIIKGVGQNGRAGWLEFYFSSSDWYIYLGTPSDRIGLSAGIGSVRASLTGYFVMGTSIPGSPPPPDEVSEILGRIDLSYMNELNALGNGSGIGFGSAFAFDTGNLTFLMFYARFKAGLGYDVMLKDYGNAKCQGRGTVGMNGWYANGQSYGYFEGSIGIKVRVFGFKKKIKILSIGAAAIMQAKLPNPFWMRGVVGGRFSVLGGAVKGSCKFEITIGEECKIVEDGSIVESVRVLSDLTPAGGQSDVNVFTTPQAVFNLPVEEVFEIVDPNEKVQRFRAKIDFFHVKEGDRVLQGTRDLNPEKTVSAFNAFDIFPPQKKLKAEVQVSFEQQRSGRWEAVVVDGKKYTEYLSSTFTSGNAPDHIPVDNVAYSYPMIEHLNLYKDEYLSGYIKLKRGQPYLFEPGSEWKQRGRFVNLSTGKNHYFDFGYATGTKEVAFNLPRSLANDQVYRFELVNLPAKASGAIDRNVKASVTKTSGDTEIRTRKAEGSIAQLQEKSIFETNFRTSKYTTFRNKINAGAITRTSREIAFLWEGLYLNNQIDLDEPYANEELVGNGYTLQMPMVQLSADLDGNSYFENYINPLIYAGYPVSGATIKNRRADSLGVVPVRAVKFLQDDTFLKLQPSDVAIGKVSLPPQNTRILYFLAPYMYYDLMDLQAQLANQYLRKETIPARVNRILWGRFPLHTPGSYHIKASYYLPGKRRPNSEVMVRTIYTENE